MPTPNKGPRLGAGPVHQRSMLANLATELFEHGRITTTEAKARRLRPFAERLITFAKRGDMHARRQVLTVVRDKGVVHELFTEIGPRFANRPGGYTRIVKVGPRKGDNAPMAIIELVEALTVAQQAVGEAERARGTRFTGGAGAAGVAAAPQASSPADAAGTAGGASAAGTAVPADDGPAGGSADPAASGSAASGSAGADPAPEAGDQPAEGTTSPQTESAAGTRQAEGERG